MPYYDRENISLYYEVHGEGEPILFLHGAAVNFQYNYEMCGWVKHFTRRGAKVIGLDFRGHGNSTKLYDTSDYGMYNLANDVIALLDHLNIDRIALVGYSLGSAIALYLMSTFPSRFSRASLVATGDGLLGIPPYTYDTIMPQLLEVLSRPEYPNDIPAHLSVFWNIIAGSGGDRKAISAFMMARYPSMDIEKAASIQAPVLVISGEQDHVLGQAPMLANSLSNGKYITIPDADHFALAFDVDVQEAVSEFLLGKKQIGTEGEFQQNDTVMG